VTEHSYTARCEWSGSTAVGYDSYDRSHTVTAPSAGTPLRMSSDPAFRGDARRLNPEQLVVAAASSCQLLEFLALAARARVDVVEYADEAEGTMDDSVEPASIQRIELRPKIVVGAGAKRERVHKLVEQAHRLCYVANSLRSEVAVEPEIVVLGE
jgi:organic hydroperoxide reductase OsmC/OhrA